MSTSQSRASGSQNTFQDSITLNLESPPISPLSSPIRHLSRQQRQSVEESSISIYRDNGSSKDQQHKRQFSEESIMEEPLDFSGSESAQSLPRSSVSVPLASAAAIAAALAVPNDMGPSKPRKSGSKGERPPRFRLGATPRIANPAPLGLLAFGLTAFCMGLYNVRAGGLSVNAPASLVITTALFYGGFGQFITGLFEFRNGNTFGGTAFLSYGLYWLSFASQQIPFFGMTAATNETTASSTFESDQRIQSGFLSLGWTLYTFLLWSLTLRSNLATSLLFFLLGLGFLLQTISDLAEGLSEGGLSRVRQVGGAVSVITGLVAWYCALAQLSRKGGRKDSKKHGNSGSMDIEADARREEEEEEREVAVEDTRRWKETEREDLERDEVNSFYELPLGVFKK